MDIKLKDGRYYWVIFNTDLTATNPAMHVGCYWKRLNCFTFCGLVTSYSLADVTVLQEIQKPLVGV